jgi:3-oxoacyl-[acyl-carrier protein] reductase
MASGARSGDGMSIRGKAAFVSGAGRNIGRAIVQELAGRGCNVVVNARANREEAEETARLARERGVEALVALGDVGVAETAKEIAAAALKRFGAVDILVNNAAIRPQRPFLELTDEDWRRVMDIDLNSAFIFSRAFLPGMVERGWGRIVNITGMTAMYGYAGRAPVSAAKHGLWGLAKALAKEFAPKGIAVNAVSPGPIRTRHPNPAQERHIESLLPLVPAGRLGEPQDIAALVGFLCSQEGGFVNGQMIGSNGAAST